MRQYKLKVDPLVYHYRYKVFSYPIVLDFKIRLKTNFQFL